jgi:hypothetical protein
MRNDPDERSSQLLRGRSLESRMAQTDCLATSGSTNLRFLTSKKTEDLIYTAVTP